MDLEVVQTPQSGNEIHRAENRKLTFRFLVDSLSGQENIRITDGNVPRCSWKQTAGLAARLMTPPTDVKAG